MSQNVTVHDTRLRGFSRRDTIQVSGSTSLAGLLASLARMGTKNKIDTLFIKAHGIGITDADFSNRSGNRAVQLCKEMLHLGNVHETFVLKGKIDKIVLYVCQAANVIDGYNGKIFCKQFAHYTDAVVIASDANQDYYDDSEQVVIASDIDASDADDADDASTSDPSLVKQINNPTRSIAQDFFQINRMDFGAWEGNVFAFHPNGSISQV